MTNLIKLAAVAMAAITLTTTLAAAAAPPLQAKPRPARPHNGIHMLECKARDGNFWIINFGTDNVDSGRQVEWSSPSTDDSGVVMLPKMLAPGEQLLLADVLSEDALPGAPCSAAFA